MPAFSVVKTSFKLWLDDVRPLPAGFTHHAKTVDEAIKLLEMVQFEEVSLDHDLGIPGPENEGRAVARFIEAGAYHGTLRPMRCRCHSHNEVGRIEINRAFRNAYKYWEAAEFNKSSEGDLK